MTNSVGAVILTTGNRMEQLDRAIASLDRQERPCEEVVLVWNGAIRRRVESDTRLVHIELDENVGIPEGRNLGVQGSTSDVILFLDDDATIRDVDLTTRLSDMFDADSDLGVVAFRVEDPETGVVLRRWVPRVGSDAQTPGLVARFPGGAAAIRRTAFTEVGGYQGSFFYGHEETELALRVLDAGFKIAYQPELVVLHPALDDRTSPERARFLGRNRVWIARLRLPVPIAVVNILLWFVVGPLKAGSIRSALAYVGGWMRGWTQSPGSRDPVTWRTVIKMARIGQPPII